MVCPRCKDTVRDIFIDLNIETIRIELGEVITLNTLNNQQSQALKERLTKRGFELLEDQNSKTIDAIKSIIIEQIHHSKESLNVNFSTLLSEKLNQDYTTLSRLFSRVEGLTIEKYILKQRIEKVKELIIYDELSLSEIAFELNYSSVAHLSGQFKREIGMTPSAFKKLNIKDRKSLDEI